LVPADRSRPPGFVFGKEILGGFDLERRELRRVLIVENPFPGRGGVGTELRILLYFLLRDLVGFLVLPNLDPANFVRHV
jgi:hypothetical protein